MKSIGEVIWWLRGLKAAPAMVARLAEENRQLIRDSAALKSDLSTWKARCDELNQRVDSLAAGCDEVSRKGDEVSRQLHDLLPVIEQYLVDRMRPDWDDRARQNAAYYTNTAKPQWETDEYFATGEANVCEQILNDMGNICQGQDPGQMRILEIGCGAGRMTKSFARIFGEVHAVDISAEMIRIAQQNLADVSNVFFHCNNGKDLSTVPAQPFDFAFSFIVFQHVPSAQVIESYLREVHRLLKPGRLFKFQVQGLPRRTVVDTWLGVAFSVEDMKRIAARCGFEMRYWHGADTQYFWLWFFKADETA